MDIADVFVGRAAERAALHRLLRAARRGRGRLVLIGGEAGVGKTALLRRVADHADRLGGVRVARRAESRTPALLDAWGHCTGPGETPPYGPWREAVAAVARHSGHGAAPLPPPLGHAPGEWTAFERSQALLQWLTGLGQPVLMVLEDLHWADAESLEMLGHVAGQLADAPVVLAVTYRTDELDARHPLQPCLLSARRLGAVDLSLNRFSEEEVAQLAAACGWPVGDLPAAAARLHRRTGGLPLFVKELVMAAARSGPAAAAAEAATGGADLPPTLQIFVDGFVERLSPAAQRLVETAAVLGSRFRPELLRRAVGLGDRGLAVPLAEAVARRVFTPVDATGDMLAFTHDLVRERVLQRLSRTGRRRLHARVAVVLEEVEGGDGLENIAFHLDRAGEPRAAAYLNRAGDRALRCGALVGARGHYERALARLAALSDQRREARTASDGGADLRAELLLKLGFTFRWEEPDRAEALWREAVERAVRCGDRAVEVWGCHFLAHAAVNRDAPGAAETVAAVVAAQEGLAGDRRCEELEAALFGLAGGFPRAAADLIRVLARRGELNAARRLLDDLLARARPGAAQELLSAGVGLALLEGDTHGAVDRCARAAREALALGDHREALRHKANELLTLLAGPADPADVVDEVAAELRQLETGSGDRAVLGWLPPGFSMTGVYQYFRGDLDGAWHNVIVCARRVPGAFGGTLRWYAGRVLLNQGHAAAARPFLESVPPYRPCDPVSMSNHFMVLAHAARAELYAALGDLDAARMWLEAAERWPLLPAAPFMRAGVRLARSVCERAAGDDAAAWRPALEALEDAERSESRWAAMRAHRLLGEIAAALGRGDGARHHFDAAVELSERCGFPVETALTRLARGRALPRWPGARADLEAAASFFEQAGGRDGRLSRRLAAEARAALAPVRGAAHSVAPGAGLPAALTRREAEVVALVAHGLTDREIADRLCISPRTVDRHLRNVFNKLGVGNRTALAVYAARNGLA